MWSSNGKLNAGQGPKTSDDYPPIVVRLDEGAFSEVNAAAGVSGAGIAAFQPDPTVPAPDVFLIAPRGTVDAGAGGVRSAGNIYVAAFQVANAASSRGVGTSAVPGTGGGQLVARPRPVRQQRRARRPRPLEPLSGSQSDLVERSTNT